MEALAHGGGGHQQLSVMMLGRVARQPVEQVRNVRADLFIRREKPQVRVEFRGARIIIPRGHVNVPADFVAFPPNHQRHLGMHLQTHQAVNHVDAVGFQRPGPLDIALFIEAGFQLHQHRHLFAVLDGVHQRRDDRRVAAGAV